MPQFRHSKAPHCALSTVEDQTASTWRRLARARRRYLRCLVGSRWLLRAPVRHTTRVSMRSGHLIQTCSFSKMPECVRLLQNSPEWRATGRATAPRLYSARGAFRLVGRATLDQSAPWFGCAECARRRGCSFGLDVQCDCLWPNADGPAIERSARKPPVTRPIGVREQTVHTTLE